MARVDDSRIADRIDEHQRADVRRKWESAVKSPDLLAIAASDFDAMSAITGRFDAMERSIAALKKGNLEQAEAFARHRMRSRLLLIAAVLIGAVAGVASPRLNPGHTSEVGAVAQTPPELPPRRAAAPVR